MNWNIRKLETVPLFANVALQVEHMDIDDFLQYLDFRWSEGWGAPNRPSALIGGSQKFVLFRLSQLDETLFPCILKIYEKL